MGRIKQLDLARLYHANSSNSQTIIPDFDSNPDARPLRFTTYPGSARIALTGRDLALPATLGDLLAGRGSVRDFSVRALPLDALGRLLYATYGVLGTRQVDGEWTYKRPAPSAGALYPLELYAACQNVEQVPDGLFHYDARAHELELLRAGQFHGQLAALTLGQRMIERANIVVMVAAVTSRTMWKYGQRGYRYVLLDAGHMAQNFCLTACALGLGAVPVGGFFDDPVNELVGLTPTDAEIIYMLCAGQHDGSTEGETGRYA